MCPVWVPEHLPPSYRSVMCYCPPVEEDWRERVRLYRNSLGNSTADADHTESNDVWDSRHDVLSPMSGHGVSVRKSPHKRQYINPGQVQQNNQHQSQHTNQFNMQHTNQYQAQHTNQYQVQHTNQYQEQHTNQYQAQHTDQYQTPHTNQYQTLHTNQYQMQHTNQYQIQHLQPLSESSNTLPKTPTCTKKSVTKLDQRLGKLRQQTLTGMIREGGKESKIRDEETPEPKRKKRKNTSSTEKVKEPKQKNSKNLAPVEKPFVDVAHSFSTLKKTSNMPEYERSHILHHMKQAGEVAMTILYQNGSSLLRLPTDKLEGFNGEVKGCVVAFSVCDPCTSCDQEQKNMDLVFVLFSLNNAEKEFLWTRNILEDLMASSARKICFNGQKLIQVLTESLQPDHKAVCKSWKVLDLRVAGWLLNPDYPSKRFSQLVECTKLKMVDTPNSEERVCGDIRMLGPTMQNTYHSLKNQHLWDLFLNVETALCPILALWELRGVGVSTKKLMYYCDMLKRKLDKLQRDAHDAAGEPFVINSHAQLRHVLFDKLKLDTLLGTKAKIARTSSGNQKSTSEAVLNQLESVHPLPKLVLEYRQIQKLKSTYIDGMVACVTDGCIYTHWDQTSAATGRLASTHPNIQSIPKQPLFLTDVSDDSLIVGKQDCTIEVNARDAFVSRKGCSFLAADFQQIEFRLFAHLANDESLIRLFNHPAGHDVFTLLTSEWLGKCCEEVTEIERDQTKRIVYSVMYGVGKERLSEYLKISASAAKGVMDSFLVKFPGVNRFTSTCREEAKQKGFLCTIFKRRRWFPSINSPNFQLRSQSERQAVNFRVQGSAADLCKAAMIQIEHSLASKQHLQTRMLVQIHDELLFDVPDAEIEEVKDIVRRIMEDSRGLCEHMVQLKVPLKVSLKVGKSWGKMENTP